MNSLSGRYILIFLAILVIPVFVLGILLDTRYYRQLKNSALAKNQELTDRIGVSLDTEIVQIQILSAGLINDLNFLDSCERYMAAVGSEASHSAAIGIEAHLDSFFRYTSRIGIIYLSFPGRPAFYYQNYPVTRSREFGADDLLNAARENPGVNQTLSDLFGVNPAGIDRPMLSIAVSPSSTNTRDGLEAMLLSFRLPLLDDIHSAGIHGGDTTVLTDGRGGILLASGPPLPSDIGVLDDLDVDLLETGSPLRAGRRRSRGTYLVTSASFESTDWRLYRILDYNRFVRPLLRSRSVTYVFFVFLSLVFVFYTLVFFRSLLRPLQNIIHRMSLAETGDYTVRVPVDGHGEMAHLATAFNSMITEIRRLTEEGRAREAEKNRYEMEALQYRIHPHFVANTLNSIRIMADAENAPHISEMSVSLMRLITESFNKGGRLISLGDEMMNLESYIHIMKVRFGELIELEFDIPDDLKDQQILKMMLQPIVENSVLHGIRESDRPGLIRIAAGLIGDVLSVSVEDNGAGIPEGELEQLLQVPTANRNRGFTPIGIYNVNRRIMLNYGDGYGLAISSRRGDGTTVILRVPAAQADDE